MSDLSEHYIYAAALVDVQAAGCLTVQVDGRIVALFANSESIYAMDNRCPHMGFPLEQGTVKDGILTCHWHHARFDLESGGTFDQWADDVRRYPVKVRGGEIWLDVATYLDPSIRQQERLLVGLERDIPLVIGKSVLVLAENERGSLNSFRSGLEFGTAFRWSG